PNRCATSCGPRAGASAGWSAAPPAWSGSGRLGRPPNRAPGAKKEPAMKCLVTGAVGFIGSHLCERLVHAGHNVVGIDAFIPYYPRLVKESNLAAVAAHQRFAFHAVDLRTAPPGPLLDGVEVVFHLAA